MRIILKRIRTSAGRRLNWLSKFFKALWLFIAGVSAVGAIYYLLIGVEQGIDVVIQSGESIDRGVLTVLAVFLWAFLVWYSSRTLSYIKQHKDDESSQRRRRRMLRRPCFMRSTVFLPPCIVIFQGYWRIIVLSVFK